MRKPIWGIKKFVVKGRKDGLLQKCRRDSKDRHVLNIWIEVNRIGDNMMDIVTTLPPPHSFRRKKERWKIDKESRKQKRAYEMMRTAGEIIQLELFIFLLWTRIHCYLYLPIPLQKFPKKMPKRESLIRSWVTPLCPKSCPRNATCCQNKPRVSPARECTHKRSEQKTPANTKEKRSASHANIL